MSFEKQEIGLRKELAKVCRVAYLCEAAGDGLGGHISVRLDQKRILIKPRSVSWLSAEPRDFIVMSFRGVRLDGPANEQTEVREWPIHAQLYASHPSVRCVLHAHPAASTLMAASGIAVEPIDQDCAGFAGQLPVLDNGAVSICTQELGNQVACALGGKGVLLIKNHGSVVAGPSIAVVCDTAHRLEKVAQTMLRAASIARLPLMSEEARSAVLRAREAAKSGTSGSQAEERYQMLQSYYLSRPQT